MCLWITFLVFRPWIGQPGPVIFPRLNMCGISSGRHSYQVPICQISGGRYRQLLVDLPEDRRSYEFCTKWLFATRPDRNSHPPDLRPAVCSLVVPTRMLFIRHYNQRSTVTWPFKLCSLLLFTSLPLGTWLCQGIKLGLALNLQPKHYNVSSQQKRKNIKWQWKTSNKTN